MAIAQTKQKVTSVSSPDTFAADGVLRALPDALIVFDEKSIVHFKNPAAQEFFGVAEGATLNTWLSAHPVLLQAAKAFLQNRKSVTLHNETILASFALLTEPFFILTLRRNAVQDHAARFEKLRQSLKSAQMIAKTLAHEIKNPLAGIRGAAQLLARLPLKEDDLELVHLIGHETSRIQRIVEDVRLFDDAAAALTPLNIHAVLDHVIQSAKAGCAKGLKVQTDYDPSLPDICGSHDLLVQAFMNLVKNAAEAVLPETGRIIIRTRFDSTANYHPEHHAKLPFTVEIEDNGRGIPPDIQPHLFDPYFTTKEKGAGLGLPIVAKIIDDHGGIIGFTSMPEKTVFKVSLPLSLRSTS